MNLITREIINKDIIFTDVNIFNLWQKDKQYTYQELDNLVNICKNILQNEYNCKAGETVLIGILPSLLQTAAFFACAELGLVITIVDHGRDDDWIKSNYVDPKTKSLLPINYFIDTSDNHQTPKYKLFYKICDHVVQLKNLDTKDKSVNTTILCDENSVLLKCTSSGTTGSAKIINHTHNFLHRLVYRNKDFFSGNMCMAHNLNHGSSPATYFLPALVSKETKIFVSFMLTYVIENYKNVDERYEFALKKFTNLNIDHFMIPYSHMIDNFLSTGTYPNLTLYTLSTIKKTWVKAFEDGKIKNMISIFGSNETSGPTFINTIDDKEFRENKYKLVDNFYKITLQDGSNLEVSMPVYNTIIKTNDTFQKVDNFYYHLGRNDLYRVNGKQVDVDNYKNILKAQISDGELIIDTVKDSLYIAIWNATLVTNVEDKIISISNSIRSVSNNVHSVNKFAILEKERFLTGIKLDHELLRDYFRNYIQ